MAVNRPLLPWSGERPPSHEKVVGLTRYGVLTLGPVSKEEWDSGYIVCWHHCPKRPADWDERLENALRRKA